jgi:hypothetical protein
MLMHFYGQEKSPELATLIFKMRNAKFPSRPTGSEKNNCRNQLLQAQFWIRQKIFRIPRFLCSGEWQTRGYFFRNGIASSTFALMAVRI